MPSKGIDCFTWISLDGWHVEYQVPKHNVNHDGQRCWRRDHLEVDSGDIHGIANFVGDFTFIVRDRDNNEVFKKTNRVNSATGDLSGGDFTSIPQMQSLVRDDCVVTFGFYDSGPGIAGLPKSHLCWATVTPNHSRWMEDVARPGSDQARKPFTTFVLPAVHDVGMNTLENVERLLHNMDDISPILGTLGKVFNIGDVVGRCNTNKIITALAITQKDNVTTMLNTGARYFEFRPAHMSTMFDKVNGKDDRIYFQHAMIPGMDFGHFLDQTIDFLAAHPTEIVVLQLRFDGVHETCARASDDDINGYINAALGAKNGEVARGNFDDMKRPIDDLRNEKKRLIVLQNAGQYSTYSDPANATLDGVSIAASFPGFLQGAAQHGGDQLFLWQCQATATNIRDVVIYSVLAPNNLTSPLLATKPICDQETLPWLMNNAHEMPSQTLQAIMNDFFDGATVDVAIDLSRGYLDRN